MVFGFILGYIARGLKDKSGSEANNSIVLLVVTLIWAVSVLFDMVSPTYETSPLVHTLMGVITGYFYKQIRKEQ